MRMLLLAAAMWPGLTVAAADAANADGAAPCPMQKARAVSYRNAAAKDVLEVAIGPGPCVDATLTIVIKGDAGRIVYSYSNPFEQHVVRDENEPLAVQATRLVDGLIADGLGSTASLPPWLPPDQYEQQHQAAILVSRKAYEDLRAHPRAMLVHLTYFEGWKTVIYDENARTSVVIVSGGT